MGKLKLLVPKKIFTWFLPLVIAGVFFVIAQPVLAEFVDSGIVTVTPNEVGIETVDGYQQIYILDKQGQKQFLTQGTQNSYEFDTDGSFITWTTTDLEGKGNIFLHSLSAHTTIQLTFSGHHQHPTVSNGKVVWETWNGNIWQISFFDGVKITPLTSTFTAITPQIENDTIIFSQRDESGNWNVLRYNFLSQKTEWVGEGSLTKRAQLQDGKVLFLVDQQAATTSSIVRPSPTASPVTTPSIAPTPITQEAVMEELSGTLPSPESTPTDATQSAQPVEPQEASSAASPTENIGQ